MTTAIYSEQTLDFFIAIIAVQTNPPKKLILPEVAPDEESARFQALQHAEKQYGQGIGFIIEAVTKIPFPVFKEMSKRVLLSGSRQRFFVYDESSGRSLPIFM